MELAISCLFEGGMWNVLEATFQSEKAFGGYYKGTFYDTFKTRLQYLGHKQMRDQKECQESMKCRIIREGFCFVFKNHNSMTPTASWVAILATGFWELEGGETQFGLEIYTCG